MIGINGSLEIARRALRAQQFAMNVVGNNIANANTPGFSRRRVDLQAAPDLVGVHGSQGTGVRAGGVSRVREPLLDRIYREHHSGSGRWDAVQTGLAQVEAAVLEPSGGGLSGALGAFWSAWQDLANEPENHALRVQVRERSVELTRSFRRLSAHLDDVRNNVTDQLEVHVERINQIAARVAGINKEVIRIEASGQEAAGLRDERDLLLDELSQLASITTTETAQGSTTVRIGAEVLVQEVEYRELDVSAGSAPKEPIRLLWRGTSQEAVIEGGRLRGLLNVRDDYLARYRNDLDTLATTLVREVNTLHMNGTGLDGSTGHNFFDAATAGAGDLRLDVAVVNNIEAIAASQAGLEGDGRQALAIAQLQSAMLLQGGRATLDDFYQQLTGQVGLDAEEAQTFFDAEKSVLLDVDEQRQGVSGVSIDEEMTAMLSTQHAYDAMVRVTSAIDEMMATLINSV